MSDKRALVLERLLSPNGIRGGGFTQCLSKSSITQKMHLDATLNPIRTEGGGGVGINPLTIFCLLLKKFSDDPYLKFLDFSQPFFPKHLVYTLKPSTN